MSTSSPSVCVRRTKRIPSSESDSYNPPCNTPDSLLNDLFHSTHVSSHTLELLETKTKGKGVQTTTFIPKGTFVIEYKGELIEEKEVVKRNEIYNQNEQSITAYGSYMFHFKHGRKKLW